MRYSFLIQAAVLVSSAVLGRADDCDDSQAPFAPTTVGGVEFNDTVAYQTSCDSYWSRGEVIIGIKAWRAAYQVKAVQFKFSRTGWGDVRGDSSGGDSVSAEWETTDEVGVTMWQNNPDDGNAPDAVGKIQITKSGDSIFEAAATKKGKVMSADQDVPQGGGIILGAKSQAGAWVSSLEFLMLKSKIVSSDLTDIVMAEDMIKWNEEQKGIDKVSLADIYYGNKNPVGGNNMTFSFTNEESKTESKSISSSTTNSWAAGIAVKVGGKIGVPLLAEASVDVTTSFDYTRTQMSGTETSESSSKSLSYSLGTPFSSSLLQPQTAVHCTAWAISGKFSSAYTGTVTSTLSDGSTFESKDAGSFDSVGWVKGSTSCETMALNKVPDGVDVSAPSSEDTKKRAVKFVS